MSPAPVPGEGAGPPGQEAVSIRLTYHSFSPSHAKTVLDFGWFAKVPGSGTGRYPCKGLVQVAPVQVALCKVWCRSLRYRLHFCKGLVPGTGRPLQRFGAGPGPSSGPGPPFWADIAGPGPPPGPGPASASERAHQKCHKCWKQACGSVIDSLYLPCLT